MRLTFFRFKPRADQQPHSYHHNNHTYPSYDDSQQKPQHYFHQLKANGALVLHRPRRSSMDEILDGSFIGTPQPSSNKKPKIPTWSPATASSKRHRPSILTAEGEGPVATGKGGVGGDKDNLQQRRQELLKHYLSEHQHQSSKLSSGPLSHRRSNNNKINSDNNNKIISSDMTEVVREEKLEREVQHLKRMVTLLRTMVFSSSSTSSSLDSSGSDTSDDGASPSLSHRQAKNGNDTNSSSNNVTYERKLQILFQEISALHKEQEASAMRHRELQQRHDVLCAKLCEKDEMISCLQSDLRALMVSNE
ncbi:hypothetical protein BDB00DRAFT_927954 [Zychaea mexicana]|uniref:uncharacterized protein n=1 Tax=Zychaea mexicana TaxID=64656 RepID=UPI0022FEC974|nr:uncharacterized protein BDB00DRAFT_927954 [Zychaea mexicana]KAI9494752.1 hypothetical protein BDB00DRAFT_927954 [Zychaea mexicana]